MNEPLVLNYLQFEVEKNRDFSGRVSTPGDIIGHFAANCYGNGACDQSWATPGK